MTSFLSLLREIRDLFYLYLIKQKTKATDFSSKYCTTTFQLKFDTAIFLVNRQIHYEASQTLYGLNTFAVGIDHCSPLIPRQLETLNKLSLSRWIRKFVVKLSFLEGFSEERSEAGEVTWRLNPHALPRMSSRLQLLVKIFSRMSKIDSLHVVCFLPGRLRKDWAPEGHLRVLGLFAPLYGRVVAAKVEAYRAEVDEEDNTAAWKAFVEQLKGIERALKNGKEKAI